MLVDDHLLFRKGIASMLSDRQKFTVVGEAGDGVEAVRVAIETKPDLVLLDIHMPKRDGLETIKILKQELPETEVVMLTVSDDEEDLFEAIKAGAKGYLLKNLHPQQLYAVLEGIGQGEAAISGKMASKILQELNQSGQEPAEETDPDALTEREVEVLEQVVTGATNKEIAATLHITENTVKIHLRNILEKLHVQNRIQAAVRAVHTGLVEEEAFEDV
jgi:DNA-binding NarL/FixJ family response regulator